MARLVDMPPMQTTSTHGHGTIRVEPEPPRLLDHHGTPIEPEPFPFGFQPTTQETA